MLLLVNICSDDGIGACSLYICKHTDMIIHVSGHMMWRCICLCVCVCLGT